MIRFCILLATFMTGALSSSAHASMTLTCISDAAVKMGLDPSSVPVLTLYRDVIYLDQGVNKRKTFFTLHDQGQMKENLLLQSVVVPPAQQHSVLADYVGFTHRYRVDARLYHPDHRVTHGRPYRLNITRKYPGHSEYSSWVCRHGFN